MEQVATQSTQSTPSRYTDEWKNGLWFSYSDHLIQTFGEKVIKITVSAGFTCPTRDGTKGTEGCAFCDERGSASFYSTENTSLAILKQIEDTKPRIRERFGAKKFLAYFQSFTNTYGPTKYLREVYDSALNVEDVVGMAVGTRPDCVPNEVLALLNEYGRSKYVSIELGLQSFSNEALDFYQRGHSSEEGIDAVQRALRFSNLNVNAHLMFGAPSEMRMTAHEKENYFAESAKKINALNVHGVKIHQLMILRNTILATRFAVQPWPVFEMDEYNRLVSIFLENLNPNIHVERTHALSSHREELVAPAWASARFKPMNGLTHLMQDSQTYQGKRF